MESRSFLVYGRVQGVGFRAFVARTAETYQVSGWVKNDSGGSVSGCVQGDGAAIQGFLQTVEQGNRWSQVQSMDVRAQAPTETIKSFQIRR